MPPENDLPPDPDALEKWQQLPKGQPSRQAYTPATGGTRYVWWLMAGLGLLVLALAVFQLLA